MEQYNEFIEMLEGRRATILSALLLAAGIAGEWCDLAWLGAAMWGTIAISGLPLLNSALHAMLVRRRINSALLVSIGMAAAVTVGEQTAAAEIALIMAVGEMLEHGTVHRARKGLEQVIRQRPTQGRRLTGQAEEMVPVEQLAVGDVLRVKPGELIPLDATVLAGHSSVNQALLTGESLPEDKAPGSAVFAGSLNGEGSLDIRVERTETDSSLQRLIRLVEESEKRQAPMQREVDRWAQWLVPCSLALAIAGFVVLRLLGFEQHEALLRAVTVLVTFCPCGLALATPTCVMAAIGQAARKGVIIKGGEALETLGKVDTLAFDKTGTLTLGKPQVCAAQSFGTPAREEVVQLAAAVERHSEHPLAKAVVEYAGRKHIRIPDAENFASHPGRGVEATVQGRQVVCGTAAALQGEGLELPPAVQAALSDYRRQGMATILVAQGGAIIGLFALSDTLRPETAEVLGGLGACKRILLTGDHRQAAEHLAQQLPLDEVHAEMLPGDKADIVLQLRQQGRTVAMVGDGVNDAPALKNANVGIAMSRLGSDLATEAADVSLMHDDLTQLPYLLRLSRATLHSIRFNIALALGINAVAVALGLLGVLTPLTGALMHNAGSLLVILNAAMLHDREFDELRS